MTEMNPFASILARAARHPRRIALPEATDPRILAAAARLASEGIASPVLVGAREAIVARAAELGIGLSGIPVEDPSNSPHRAACEAAVRRAVEGTRHDPREAVRWIEDPVYFADALVAAGEADGCVSGAAHTTADTLRAALRVLRPGPGVKVVSSFFLMALREPAPAGDRILAFADCGLVPYPDAAELADIARRTAASFRRLTGGEPRVALLSFSTKGSASHEAVDKVVQAREALAASIPDFPFDGELQLDAAIDPGVGVSKAPGSAVAGRANVLVFPNLDAGNIGYKLVQRFAGAIAVGPVLQGLSKPANDLSRGCSAEDVVLVSAVTSLQAEG